MIKNELICNNLETSLNSSTDQVSDSVSIFCGVSFEQFNVVSEADIGKIFGSSPTKSCALDPIPTWLLKQYQDQLAPVLTTIVNASLSCAQFPTERKKAFLTPLIKKMIIDCEILRIIGLCLIYLSFQSLWNALLCSIIGVLENQQLVWDISLCLQTTSQQRDSTPSCTKWPTPSRWQWGRSYFSTAWFKCCIWYHRPWKLLNLLNQSFGIRDVAFKQFQSYLKDRAQTVQIGSCTSTPITLKYGVPQGSVLGPTLFTMYTTILGNIIRKHGLNFHLYADDTQLYISFQPGVSVSKETAISCLEACIKDIKIWMTNNLLKRNDDKTELINCSIT